ncbi:MAG TPA: hypothetical protein VKZ48_00130 [Burkholderiales bacterium]|nr:hypothetical protein [Burkholderiales bacterium]
MDLTPSAAYFAGHFPAQPILPGITQIALAVAAMRREAEVPTLRAVRHARLRRLVAPGDRLALRRRPASDALIRFELRVADRVVTNGEVEFGPLVSWEGRLPAFGPVVDHPPIEQLLPHRPPMLFVRRVLAQGAEMIVCEAELPPDCPLADESVAPAITAVEAAAQAAAVWEGLRRRDAAEASSGSRMGYLVSLRDVVFTQASLPVKRPFQVVVRLESRMPPLSTYAVEAYCDGLPLLRGEIGTFLAGAD